MRRKSTNIFAIFSLAFFMLSQLAPLQLIQAEILENQSNSETIIVPNVVIENEPVDESALDQIPVQILNESINVDSIDSQAIEPLGLVQEFVKDETIKTNTEYFSDNGQASIVFSKLPEGSFEISINNVAIENSAINKNAITPAYEFTTTPELPAGSFEATITLPLTKTTTSDVQVSYSEDGVNFVNDSTNTTIENNTVSFIVDHFTIFVVVNPNTQPNCDAVTLGTTSGITCFSSIQAAIVAAANGDTINVANGTYIISSTINVDKQLTISGESQAGVTINMSGMSTYGWNVTADNVTIQNMTVMGTAGVNPASRTFKFGNPMPIISNGTLRNITVTNGNRTPFDIHGVDNFTGENLTATGTVSGVGLSLTGVNGANITGFSGGSNAWGDIAIFGSIYTTPNRGSSNITIVNNPNIGAIYGQDVSPSLRNDIGTITVTGRTFVSTNPPLDTIYTFSYTSPVVDIDETALQIIAGEACGIGSAVSDDGLSVNITNWDNTYTIQGRYFLTGGSFGGWNNINSLGTLTVTPPNANLYVSNTGNSPAGLAGWEVRIVDSGNNVISNIDSLNYNIVTDPATFVCNGLPMHQSPADGAIVNSSSLILDWSEITSGNGGVTYTYQSSLLSATNPGDNSLTTPIYTTGSLVASDIDRSGSGEATYYWQVRACDSMAICTNWTNPWELTVDNTSPVLVFNNNVSATPTSSDTINVTATDLNLDIATLEYGFSADAICNSSDTYGNSFTNTTDFSINSSANNGQYLCVRATDLAGNTGYVISANVLNIDDVDPTIGAVSAVTTYASQYVRGNGVGFDIRMNATDANGITACEYSLTGGAPWIAGTYNTVPATDRCEGLDVTAADGTVLTITMRATDGAGNISTGTSIIRTADSTNPVVSGFSVTPNILGLTSSNPTLNFTVTDSVSPIILCQVRYRVTGSGGAGWSVWTAASNSTPGLVATCSTSIVGLTDGTSYDFQARGRDTVNHNSAVSLISGIIVDATIPNTVFTSPANGSNWNTAITISGNSTDTNGIDFVTVEYSPAGMNTWTTLTVIDNTLNDSPFNWIYNWTPGSEGSFDFRASSTDIVGNTDSTAIVTDVTYDITAPNVTFDGFRNQASAAYNPVPAINSCGSINTSGYIAWEWTLNTIELDPVAYTYRITAGPTAVGFTANTTNTYFNGGIPMQGTYTVEVYGTDSSSNVGNTIVCAVTFDATSPVTILNAPVASPSNDNTPTFTGTGTDNLTNVVNVEYRYTSDGGMNWSAWMNAIANDTFDSNSEGFSFTTGALADGNYIFQSRATDGAGLIESITNDASQQMLVIDTTAPTAVTPEWGYNTPAMGYVSNSGTGLARQVACGGFITTTDLYRGLWAESTDLSGIAGYERDVTYNGSYVGTYAAGTNYTTSFTPFAGIGANGGQGTYAVRIRAIDNAGNASIDNTTWANKTVNGTWCTMTIDITSPVTILNAPVASPSNDNTPTFTGTGTDNLTNVVNVEYRYTSDGGMNWSAWMNAIANDTFDSNSEGFSFTTGALADGNYIFQSRATDGAGLIESITNDASQQMLVIDTTAPVVTVDYLETRDRTPELTGTVDDTTAVISVTVNGNTYPATNNADGTWTLVDGSILTNLPNRYYDVIVTATDAATNVGTDATTLDLIVDRIQPALTLGSLAGGEYLSGAFVVSGTLSDPLLSDGNPGVGIMDLRVRFRRESDNVLVATCWAVYDSMSNTYSLNVNDGGSCNVTDGEYLIRLRAQDNLSNTRWLTINNVTIDNVTPTVSSLSDATFNEGDALPALGITGTDNVRIAELCVDINSSPLGTYATMCFIDDGNMNTTYVWNLSNYVSSPFVDTSMFSEGIYDISYFVMDMAGNSSAIENVIYTIVNVAPQVTFGSDQTINEGENAIFSASFIDPSTNDSGDMTYDDASWSATVDFGDGSAVLNLGDFATSGSITIPNHVYVNNGAYTATVEVCEEDPMVNSESEGECRSETVTITVNNVVPSVVINASPSTSVLAGTNVTLTADVSGNVLPGNQIASYAWSGDCSGAGASFVLGTPTARAYNCTVLVTDIDGDTATANITISASNGIPSVVIIANPGVNVNSGTTVTLIGNILGGDANFSYVWSAACSGAGTNSGGLTNTTTVPSTPGSYYCRIDVTDSNGDTAAAGVIIAVNNASTGGGGVGGPGGVLGANTDDIDTEESETTEEEEEIEEKGNILGALVCDTKQELSGKVQNKENSNGVENVAVTVYYFENNQKIQVGRVITNSNGEWKIEVCPGQYNVEIDESTLPSGSKLDTLSAKVLSVSVQDDTKTQNVNFNVMFDAGFNWLVIIIPLLILFILFIMFLISRRREEE